MRASTDGLGLNGPTELFCRKGAVDHRLTSEAGRVNPLELERVAGPDPQQQRLLRPEGPARVRERLGQRGGGIARGPQDLQRARERLQQVMAARGGGPVGPNRMQRRHHS